MEKPTLSELANLFGRTVPASGLALSLVLTGIGIGDTRNDDCHPRFEQNTGDQSPYSRGQIELVSGVSGTIACAYALHAISRRR